MSHDDFSAVGKSPNRFHTTEWTVVLAAGDDDQQAASDALERLCEAYWQPLYAYVRRHVSNVHDAQDLTQAFFSRFLEKNAVAKARRERGRFRSFLLTSMKNFLAGEWGKARAQKRGGGKTVLSLNFDQGESRLAIEPCHSLTPERLYDRRWITTLLERVLESLHAEWTRGGKARQFDELKAFLTDSPNNVDYESLGARLRISPAAAKQAVYRLRKRYRELLRSEVARTVETAEDVDDELGRLLECLREP